MNTQPLALFHPLVAEWFRTTLGTPSDIQTRAWPEIAAGNHVLVTAPTGSGKTLTAFLWALNQLITRKWSGDQVRVLYVSPLKALNNDVHRNLNLPLTQLHGHFHGAGQAFPMIRVQTRSGDTPQDERRRMLKRPPEILITTPESLNILISSKAGRRLLTGLKTVILDEIHAVIAGKRGTHLMTAVDRLVPLCGEFQRIALSATVRPMEKAAEFIGGYRLEGDKTGPVHVRRKVVTVAAKVRKHLEVSIRFPAKTGSELPAASVWPALIEAFKILIHQHRSTLFFANSRRLSEKVARLLNENEPLPLAYSHHGSLAKEIRLAVEQRLKQQELRAIVATNSLELGIDIGNLDQVALIQTPISISSAVQRIGRSGHQVGAVSRGVLFPTHGRDFIHAAVMARCVTELTIEAVEPPECPLDVLAQVLLSMVTVETWDLDELFTLIRTSAPYHHLSRRHFDLVLDMLAGRYADTRIRELRPRLLLDRTTNKVQAKSGNSALLFLGGGTIPDRGYFDLRLQGDRSKIGELDEEFVWERHVGETFALGVQTWRIQRITANDVEVLPAESRPGIIPFWRAEARNRDFHFSEKIGEFLEAAEKALPHSVADFVKHLTTHYFMEPQAAAELSAFLQAQQQASRAPLPHRRHLLVEHFDDPLNRADKKQVILHTLWGGRVNRPLAVALAAAWERAHGYRLEVFADDDAVLVMLPHDFDAKTLLQMVHSGNVELLLRERLESTGLFSACFRENAGRALLLPKLTFGKRMPLWLNRLRAKKLLDAVMGSRDFPLLLETWRTCLQDIFDLPNLKMLLDELAQGAIKVSEAYTTLASPFAAGLIWQQTNTYMYKDDTPEFSRKSALAGDLIREISLSAGLRPNIPRELTETLEHKLQRTAPGYAPGSALELLDWVRERLLIPMAEWMVLLAAVSRDHAIDADALLLEIGHRLLRIRVGQAVQEGIAARENLPRLLHIFGSDTLAVLPLAEATHGPYTFPAINGENVLQPLSEEEKETDAPDPIQALARFLSQWLAYYGPVPLQRLKDLFEPVAADLEPITSTLLESGLIVLDLLTESAVEPEICDLQNLEILLRMLRKARKPAFAPLPIRKLPLFMADFQGLTAPGEAVEDLQNRLEQLFGYCAPAADWEQWILPARLRPYFPAWLDSLIHSYDLRWFGAGKEKIGFAFEEDLPLFQEPLAEQAAAQTEKGLQDLIPEGKGRYALLDLARQAGISTEAATRRLWDLAWAGRIGSDNFAVLRSGILNRFTPQPLSESSAAHSRGRFNRWKAGRPMAMAGNWFILPGPETEADGISRLESDKERVRQLLQRYGIVFRELLNRELPRLQWKNLFKALRLMELSGEVLSGAFFEGIGGLQFISPEALGRVQAALPEDAVFWMNATDPASACGLNLKALKSLLPARQAATFLVFHGARPVLIARKNSLELTIQAQPDSPHLPRYFALFKDLLNREFNPRRSIRVEKINAAPALDSPYAPALKAMGFVKDHKGFELRRRYD